MKAAPVTLALLLTLCLPSREVERTFGGIELLDGYKAERGQGFDTTLWTIRGRNGFEISYESGLSEGQCVRVENRDKYLWYRERQVHGYTVRDALVKSGTNTLCVRENNRSSLSMGTLLVTVSFRGPSSSDAANFVANVADTGELADALLMIATYDPFSKDI